MTPEQKAAYVNAQSACALCERAAMTWQNNADDAAKRPLTYTYAHFIGLMDKYGLHHNQVLTLFRE